MKISDRPVNIREYFKAMKTAVSPKYDKIVEKYEECFKEELELYNKVKELADTIKESYSVDVYEYKEFVENTYIDGSFLIAATEAFTNKRENYKATTILYKLYRVATLQETLYNLNHDRHLYEKMLSLKFNEYRDILSTFYTEVHKKLIVDGYGYMFEKPLGWTCINRCKIVNSKPLIDWNATRQNKEKLLAEGKRLWNKQEAEYAKQCGLDYDGVDYRVYLKSEVTYEIPLIGCRIDPDKNFELKTLQYDPVKYRGTTDEEIIEATKGDINKICEYPFDIKHKLRLCIKADDILYLNFIRNENQQPACTPANRRKDRQRL